jgi:hypothetical protein
MRWIETQVAPTLLVVKRLMGIKWLLRWLIYCMRNVELTPQKEKQIQFEQLLLENRQNKAFLYYNKKMEEEH